jgi:hypothetical protein
MEASPQAEAVPGWLGQSIYASILVCREITPAPEVCYPMRKVIEMFCLYHGFYVAYKFALHNTHAPSTDTAFSLFLLYFLLVFFLVLTLLVSLVLHF